MVLPASSRQTLLQARLRGPAECVGPSDKNSQQCNSNDPSRCKDGEISDFHGLEQELCATVTLRPCKRIT